MVPHLPLELHICIVDQLRSGHEISYKGEPIVKETLQALRLVSTLTSAAATPALFERSRALPHIDKLLSIANSHLGHHVRILGVYFGAEYARGSFKAKLSKAIKQLPALEEFKVRGAPKGLHTGRLEALHQTNVANFISRLLAQEKNLQKLKILEILNMPSTSTFRQDLTGPWPGLGRLQDLYISHTNEAEASQNWLVDINNTLAQASQLSSLRMVGLMSQQRQLPLALSAIPTKVLMTVILEDLSFSAGDFSQLMRSNQCSMKGLILANCQVRKGTWGEVFRQICELNSLDRLMLIKLRYDPLGEETKAHSVRRISFPTRHPAFPDYTAGEVFQTALMCDLHSIGDLYRFVVSQDVASFGLVQDDNSLAQTRFANLLPYETIRSDPSRLGRCFNGKKYVLAQTIMNGRTRQIERAIVAKMQTH